jgi:hypothetical protein
MDTGLLGRGAMAEVPLQSESKQTGIHFYTRDELLAERKRMFRSFMPIAGSAFSDDPETRKVLILGDSMAQDLYDAMMANSERFEGMEIRRIWLDDPCMPYFTNFLTTGEVAFMEGGRCRPSITKLRDGSLFPKADVIVLTAYWPLSTEQNTHLGAITLAQTLAAQGRQVSIVGLVAIQNTSSRVSHQKIKGLTVSQLNEEAYSTRKIDLISKANADVRALAAGEQNIRYLDKFALFCVAEKRTCALFDSDKQILFADGIHLSSAGVRYFGKRIADLAWFEFDRSISAEGLSK